MTQSFSLKYILIPLYALLIVCMGGATVIEKFYGSDFVSEHIYGSWWFIALWSMLAFVSLTFLVQRKVHRKVAVFILHLSFLVMLVGALLTHLTSADGMVHLRVDGETSSYVDDNNGVCQLPFTMCLRSFDIHHYPGTDAVMDYCCSIDVRHDDNSLETLDVSMNNIGKCEGYRFYQSSYDEDGQGTHLLVAYDPYGITVTYIGYVMLFISLLWTMLSRHTRIRHLYRVATRPLVALLLLAMLPIDAGAQSQSSARALTTVSSDIAHAFGKVVILYNGRLCPVNTAATEFVTKLSGKNTWKGYSADEVFVGWMIYYSEWEEQKIIRVKSAEVQQLLGINGSWASVSDFYDSDNKYKLAGMSNSADIPEPTRKAIREVDEKMQVVSMFYNSEMLKLFPLIVDGKLQWHTPGSTDLPLGISEDKFQFINHAMDHLVKRILVNDTDGAKQMIAKIRLYQKDIAGDVLPSATMVNAEVFYNTLLSMRWIVFLYLTLNLLLCMFMLSGKGGRVVQIGNLAILYTQVLYLTLLFLLRWVISGHVPMSNGYETMLFMALVTLLITFLAMRRIPVLKALGPVVSSFCMLVAILASGSPQITTLMPVLQSPLLSVHVAMVMIAYALLAMITLLAVYGFYLNRKQQQAQLERITALSQLMLYPAILTLCVGIFIGAVWANVSWGTYWSWDPKETWALITLMIYAVPLHKSSLTNTPKRYHLYVLIAFLTVLMTYFGVNYFLSGMHSYA